MTEGIERWRDLARDATGSDEGAQRILDEMLVETGGEYPLGSGVPQASDTEPGVEIWDRHTRGGPR